MMMGIQRTTVSHPGGGDVVRIGPDKSVMTPKVVFGITIVLRSLKVKSHRVYA